MLFYPKIHVILIKHEFGNVCAVNPGMCDELSVLVILVSAIGSVLAFQYAPLFFLGQFHLDQLY